MAATTTTTVAAIETPAIPTASEPNQTHQQIIRQQYGAPTIPSAMPPATLRKQKLFGRAFYESIGSPKKVVAPMVDQSEFVSPSFFYSGFISL
jgi:hypothetical protein